jgi:hypothetical protein
MVRPRTGRMLRLVGVLGNPDPAGQSAAVSQLIGARVLPEHRTPSPVLSTYWSPRGTAHRPIVPVRHCVGTSSGRGSVAARSKANSPALSYAASVRTMSTKCAWRCTRRRRDWRNWRTRPRYRTGCDRHYSRSRDRQRRRVRERRPTDICEWLREHRRRSCALRSAAGLLRAHAVRPTAAPERQRVCQLQRPVDQRRRMQLGRLLIASRLTWAGRRV